MKKLSAVAIVLATTAIAGCAMDDGFQAGALSERMADVVMADVEMADIALADVQMVDTIPDVVPADMPLPPSDRFTYILALADTHIKYADNEAADSLRAIAAGVSEMPWEIKGVFVAGDVCYLLPYTTIEEFHADPADRFDIAQEIFETFPVPVYQALGNHDMDNGPIPLRDLAHQLFQEHFGVPPYYAVDLGTWKFLVLSNFEGPTHDPEDPAFDPDSGSLGAEQLAWMEEQVKDGRPVILMTHFPGYIINDIGPFLRAHKDTVRLFLNGHSHAWMNLSDNYGVPSMVIGTSQWDPDNQMIIELDNELHTWRMINWNKVHWGSGYSLPWNDGM